MEKKIIQANGIDIAVIRSNEPLITDAQSAIDLLATISYYDMCDRIVINKEAIAEDFFDLKTGIAGEILQKFINYYKKIAIVGDFSQYPSKALRDFIYECNCGNNIFFMEDEQTAVSRLFEAK